MNYKMFNIEQHRSNKMKTHFICQNTMTGAIHVLYYEMDIKNLFTPCGYNVTNYELHNNPNLEKRSKICIKCHNSLLKSHNKNLMAYMTHIKLTGEMNGRFKI